MHGIAKRGLALAAATSGLIMGAAGVASADAATTSGGIASGNVAQAQVSVPVNVSGNQVSAAALHDSDLGSACAAAAGAAGPAATTITTNSTGLGAGNIANLPVSAPVAVTANQVGVGSIGSTLSTPACAPAGAPAPAPATTNLSTNSAGALAGNIVSTPISGGVTACGNQVGILGIGNTLTPSAC